MKLLKKGTSEYRKRFEEVRLAMDVIGDFCADMTCKDCPFRLKEGEYENSHCKFVEDQKIPIEWVLPKEENNG